MTGATAQYTPASQGADTVELSIVMPCLNEANSLPICLEKAFGFLKESGISGEVIVADNGSTDGSIEIAERLGARVVPIAQKGYGNALKGGIRAARGQYVIMGDADDSYNFSKLQPFVEKLRDGYELVMGNRFEGGIEKGAMPALHKYFGNPLLTLLARVMFRVPNHDVYCGLRGFSKSAYEKMDLQSSGMEFALEMVLKAKLMRLRITDVPTTLSPDKRGRAPHLQSWRDGRRSLRLYLLCNPDWLFLYPGIALAVVGLLVGSIIWVRPIEIGELHFDIHTMLLCAFAVLIGVQAIAFWLFAKLLGISLQIVPPQPGIFKLVGRLHLEYGLALGGALILIGISILIYAVMQWGQVDFANLNPFRMMRLVIPGAMLFTLGHQVVFSSFYLSFMKSLLRKPHFDPFVNN